jgi:hypothetical protein
VRWNASKWVKSAGIGAIREAAQNEKRPRRTVGVARALAAVPGVIPKLQPIKQRSDESSIVQDVCSP